MVDQLLDEALLELASKSSSQMQYTTRTVPRRPINRSSDAALIVEKSVFILKSAIGGNGEDVVKSRVRNPSRANLPVFAILERVHLTAGTTRVKASFGNQAAMVHAFLPMRPRIARSVETGLGWFKKCLTV